MDDVIDTKSLRNLADAYDALQDAGSTCEQKRVSEIAFRALDEVKKAIRLIANG